MSLRLPRKRAASFKTDSIWLITRRLSISFATFSNASCAIGAFHSAFCGNEIDRFADDVCRQKDSSNGCKIVEDCVTTRNSLGAEEDECSRKAKTKTLSITNDLEVLSTSDSSAARRWKEETVMVDAPEWEDANANLNKYTLQHRPVIKQNNQKLLLKAKSGVKKLLDSEVQLEETDCKKKSAIEDNYWDEEPKLSKQKKSLVKTSKKDYAKENFRNQPKGLQHRCFAIEDAFWDKEAKLLKWKESPGKTPKECDAKESSALNKQNGIKSMLNLSDQESTETTARNELMSGPAYLTQTRFDKFDISPLTKRVLHDVLKYEQMTTVQEATFPVILKGKDVLVKARTGTGKTIAFLLPAIEAILKEPVDVRPYKPIYVLIVCPTRELAQQVANVARVLLKFHARLGVQALYGGSPIPIEQQGLKRNPCHVLVGTPGRLIHHLKRTHHLFWQLKKLKIFVLDEADHMLEMGFRTSVERIVSTLPFQRQTLLFSATIPAEVHSFATMALKNDHVLIDTVGEDRKDTLSQVKQQYILVPIDKQFSVLYSSFKEHMEAEHCYKILVFCTTATVTGFMCQLFKGLGFNAREIHSKKDQAYRSRISNEFRRSTGGMILFTSDVSARGVDYPNVTLVVQVGAPSNSAQYIHRLGRAGSAGKKGEGLLLLGPWERVFLESLKNNLMTEISPPRISPQLEKKILATASLIDEKLRYQVYSAWLGYYIKATGLDRDELVEYANQFSSAMGFREPPAISRALALKIKLMGVPGLRIHR